MIHLNTVLAYGLLLQPRHMIQIMQRMGLRADPAQRWIDVLPENGVSSVRGLVTMMKRPGFRPVKLFSDHCYDSVVLLAFNVQAETSTELHGEGSSGVTSLDVRTLISVQTSINNRGIRRFLRIMELDNEDITLQWHFFTYGS